MENQELLDGELIDNDLSVELKSQRKKYLIKIVILIVLNTVLFGLLVKSPRSTIDSFLTALNANLIGFNIVGFLLGTLAALLPYKGLTYKKKYVRASLLVILTIQIFMCAVYLSIGLMTLLGRYPN